LQEREGQGFSLEVGNSTTAKTIPSAIRRSR
jgi:hypothetical protein